MQFPTMVSRKAKKNKQQQQKKHITVGLNKNSFITEK